MFEEHTDFQNSAYLPSLSKLDSTLAATRVYGDSASTHFSLNGAKYFIKMGKDNNDFLWRYGAALYHREINEAYLIERRTPRFKFHIDLDIKEPSIVRAADVHKLYLPVIFSVLQRFYNNLSAETLTCVVLSAPPKSVVEKSSDGNATCVKSGFHLHWPFLTVDDETALTLRDNIVHVLENTEATQTREWPKNSISDIVDESIYLSNGLRMVGSDKRARCPAQIQNNTRQCNKRCDLCNGLGKVDEKRPYIFAGVVKHDLTCHTELRSQLHGKNMENYIELVKLCSIRTEDEITQGFRPPRDAIMLNESRRRRLKKQERDANGAAAIGVNDIAPNSILFKYMEKFIQRSFNGSYPSVELRKVKFQVGTSERQWLCLLKDSSGSSYCMRKAALHENEPSSNHHHRNAAIYFTISEKHGLRQWCHHPTCKSEQPDPIAVKINDHTLYQSLFPTRTEMLRLQQQKLTSEETQDALQIFERRFSQSKKQEGKRSRDEENGKQVEEHDNGNCHWKTPNSTYRQTASARAPNVIQQQLGEEDLDVCDKLSFSELFRRDKAAQEEKQKIYPLLHKAAVPAHRAITQLWKKSAVSESGRKHNNAKRQRWS